MPSIKDYEGRDVVGEDKRRLGWIVHVLFSQEDLRMLGFTIERRALWGFMPRKETYVPFGELDLTKKRPRFAGKRLPGPKRAAHRYGVDWEQALILRHMGARSEDGTDLGSVRDIEVDEDGSLLSIEVSSGVTEDVAVGRTTVDAEDVLRYEDYAIVVAERVEKMEAAGGVAASAGRSTAVAKVAASGAVDKAARVSGRLAGKASKRLRKSMREWKDVFDEE